MDDAKMYQFKIQGLCILRNVISQEKVNDICSALPTDLKHHFEFLEQNSIFMELMETPEILEACKDLVGKWFRFDHSLGVCQTQKDEPYLHGGQYGSQGTCFSNGWNGQLAFGIYLTAQNENTGGFTYIPGSHKTLVGEQFVDDSLSIVPEVYPGDIVIFPESLLHGQQQWKADYVRKTLYYKYVPGYMCWQDYEQTKKYLDLAQTDMQRLLLRPPFVRNMNQSFRKPTMEE